MLLFVIAGLIYCIYMTTTNTVDSLAFSAAGDDENAMMYGIGAGLYAIALIIFAISLGRALSARS